MNKVSPYQSPEEPIQITALAALIDTLKGIRSLKEKQEVLEDTLERCPYIEKYLRVAYDPYRNHFIQSSFANEQCTAGRPMKGQDCVIPFLDLLSRRQLCGELAGSRWISLKSRFIDEVHPTLDSILDKDLHCGLSRTTVNLAFKTLGLAPIPEFRICFGEKWNPEFRFWEHSDYWYMSRNMEGIRCLAILKENRDVDLVGSSGKALNCFESIRDALMDFSDWNVILDGVIGFREYEGTVIYNPLPENIEHYRIKDNFQNAHFTVFDAIPIKTFEGRDKGLCFLDRQKMLRKMIKSIRSDLIDRVKQYLVESKKDFAKQAKRAEDLEWDGLIVRKNDFYEGQRTKNILKTGRMSCGYFKVIKVITGKKENCNERELKAAVIRRNGKKIKVRYGWGEDQKNLYGRCPKFLVGRMITIKHFETSSGSILMPIVSAVEGRE